jgi:hypothetical protein
MANGWLWAVGVGALAVVVGSAWVFVLWRAVGLLRSLSGLEDRVARLTEALALLTDTTETGFRSLTEQMVPVTVSPAPGARRAEPAIRTTTSRVVRASKQGQTAIEIAAAEQVSEGEVRLRLNLAQAATARSTAAATVPAVRKTQKRKGDHGTLREA